MDTPISPDTARHPTANRRLLAILVPLLLLDAAAMAGAAFLAKDALALQNHLDRIEFASVKGIVGDIARVENRQAGGWLTWPIPDLIAASSGKAGSSRSKVTWSFTIGGGLQRYWVQDQTVEALVGKKARVSYSIPASPSLPDGSVKSYGLRSNGVMLIDTQESVKNEKNGVTALWVGVGALVSLGSMMGMVIVIALVKFRGQPARPMPGTAAP